MYTSSYLHDFSHFWAFQKQILNKPKLNLFPGWKSFQYCISIVIVNINAISKVNQPVCFSNHIPISKFPYISKFRFLLLLFYILKLITGLVQSLITGTFHTYMKSLWSQSVAKYFAFFPQKNPVKKCRARSEQLWRENPRSEQWCGCHSNRWGHHLESQKWTWVLKHRRLWLPQSRRELKVTVHFGR